MNIRLLTKTELKDAIDFIWNVFIEFEAVNYSADGKRVFYILCGVSDILDGFIARALHKESEFGAALDSVADLLFNDARKLRRFMIMNGIKKPDCFSGIKETEFYNKVINPYELPPKSNFNIGASSDYLIKTGKNIYSLTKDEAEQFVLT